MTQPPRADAGAAPGRTDDGTVAFCTVATATHLPEIEVLGRSLARRHPDVPRLVVLLDAPPPGTRIDWRVLVPDDVLPGWRAKAFTASPAELAAAFKPAVLRATLDAGHAAAVHLDADTWACGPLDGLLAAARRHAVVLTAHRTAPRRTALEDLDLLAGGVHQAGVVAAADVPAGRAFLAWWQDRCLARSDATPGEHVYLDQRWLDLAPTYFDDVRVLRDPALNVGHWTTFEALDRDPVLLHLSRLDPHDPAGSPLVRAGGPRIAELAAAYAAELLMAGRDAARARPSSLEAFADGTPIPQVLRHLFALHADVPPWTDPDPFAVGDGSLRAWLAAPVDAGDPPVARLWLEVHALREDVRAVHPDPLGADRAAFTAWVDAVGRAELGVDRRIA